MGTGGPISGCFAMAVGISTVMAIVTGTDVELIPVLVSEDPETLQL